MTKQNDELEGVMEKFEEEECASFTAEEKAWFSKSLDQPQNMGPRASNITKLIKKHGGAVIGAALLGLFFSGNIGVGIGVAVVAFTLLWSICSEESSYVR